MPRSQTVLPSSFFQTLVSRLKEVGWLGHLLAGHNTHRGQPSQPLINPGLRLTSPHIKSRVKMDYPSPLIQELKGKWTIFGKGIPPSQERGVFCQIWLLSLVGSSTLFLTGSHCPGPVARGAGESAWPPPPQRCLFLLLSAL